MTYIEQAKEIVRNAECNKHLKYQKKKLQIGHSNEHQDSTYRYYKKITMFHEPTLADYLNVLIDAGITDGDHCVNIGNNHFELCMEDGVESEKDYWINFNLKGEPLDEENAMKFVELVTK